MLTRLKIGASALALMACVAGGALAQDREIVVAQGVDVPGFDIHNHRNTAVEAIFVNMFDYLIMRDENGIQQPSLATSWEVLSDTSIQFNLRHGVLFHDGTEMNAEDVKFSLERVAFDDSVQQNSFYKTISEVEVVDDYTVIVHTHEPDAILLNRVSRLGGGIVPKHYIESVGWDGFNLAPIGTGPFKFVEWRRDDRIIMEAFADHWRGRPDYDRLVHRTIPESSTRVGELMSGGVDIALPVPEQDTGRINESGTSTTKPAPTSRVMSLYVNTKEGSPLEDPKVREAVDLAIDDQGLIDLVMGGLGVPTRASFVPGITDVPMELYNTYLYDPERAVELLKEAGYGPGDLTIPLAGPKGRYPRDAELLEIVSVMLNQVGIKTELTILEWSAYLNRYWGVQNIDGMILVGNASSLGDGYQQSYRFVCDAIWSDMTGWCDEHFSELVTSASVTMDRTARAKDLGEAYHILTEARPILPLFQIESTVGVSTDVDWSPDPNETLWMFRAHPAAD